MLIEASADLELVAAKAVCKFGESLLCFGICAEGFESPDLRKPKYVFHMIADELH